MFLAANGVWLWTTMAVIIWIALFSILFFPLALIVAYMVGDRTTAAVE